MTDPTICVVTAEGHLQRLDKWLASQFADFSRTQIQHWIAEGCLIQQCGQQCGQLEKTVTEGSKKVLEGEVYHLTIPAQEPLMLKPAPNIPVQIIFEDEHLLIIYKQAGLTVHPGAGNQNETLVNALLALRAGELSEMGGILRPGIVHRLDKDTSGLMVVAKHDVSHHLLSTALAKREIKREYRALCYGVLTPRMGTITGNIGRSPQHRTKMAVRLTGGKSAVTHYHTLETFCGDKASLLRLRLETGRTHQIRVHLHHKGAPILGDPMYGTEYRQSLHRLPPHLQSMVQQFGRQALHAASLELMHPMTQEPLHFTAPLPEDMENLLQALREQ
jgi:23S rRNA pseudouridine1911/1915/1917 synthase